jgi:alpha-1,6-mannosyltransferase
VPRTFLGALYLAAFSLPSAIAVRVFRLPKVFLQVFVRLTLAALVCSAFTRFLGAAARRFGRRVAIGALLAATATPHFLFYSSRTLPNIFAVFLVAHGAAHWLRMERIGGAPPASAPLAARLDFALRGWGAGPSSSLVRAIG